MVDITKKILNDLNLYVGATPVGAQPDLTTWMARKLAQDRVTDTTSETILYDGDDIQEELRNYLRDVAD